MQLMREVIRKHRGVTVLAQVLHNAFASILEFFHTHLQYLYTYKVYSLCYTREKKDIDLAHHEYMMMRQFSFLGGVSV